MRGFRAFQVKFPFCMFFFFLQSFASDFSLLLSLLATREGVPTPPLELARVPHRNPTPSAFTELLKGALVNDTKLLKQVRTQTLLILETLPTTSILILGICRFLHVEAII